LPFLFKNFHRRLNGVWFFNLPLFAVSALVFIFPFFAVIFLSFYRWNLTVDASPTWIGLQNYLRLFNDSRFVAAVKRNFYFSFVATGIQLALGLGIALLLNYEIRGKKIYRTLLLIPVMCSPIVVALIWRLMLNSSFGIINYFLEELGFGRITFLGNKQWVMRAIILVDTWQWTPYVALILLAGLQSLPPEVMEAAQVEGANCLQRFTHITLPLMVPHVTTALILRFTLAFKVFDTIWGMTRGGPAFASETLYPFIYSQNFLYFWVGYASAAAVIFLFIILIVGCVIFQLRIRKVGL